MACLPDFDDVQRLEFLTLCCSFVGVSQLGAQLHARGGTFIPRQEARRFGPYAWAFLPGSSTRSIFLVATGPEHFALRVASTISTRRCSGDGLRDVNAVGA